MKRYMVFTGELREPYDDKPSDSPFVDVYLASEVEALREENRKLRHALADAVFRQMHGQTPVVVLDKHGVTIENS